MSLRDFKGSTLLGAIIMASVILAIAASMFGLFIYQGQRNKVIENQVNVAMVNAALRTVLFDPALCTASLGGQSAAPNLEIQLKNVSINGVWSTFQKDTAIPTIFPGLTINTVQFNPANPPFNPPFAAPVAGSASCGAACPNDEILYFATQIQQFQQMTGETIAGGQHVAKRILTIPLVATVIGGKIQACQSMGLYPDPNKPSAMDPYTNFDLCTSMHGTWSAGPPGPLTPFCHLLCAPPAVAWALGACP